ncbi:MAG TPA: M20/M25/M40 family metallo-hydrolase, partial [Tepidisphaeraceae bacterium]|nr:M20/M25/M40 family metallo-hydrolase [Tepidisphaeraceae bacterium]
LAHANQWTRDRLESWGLVNAHAEEWGTFGRGWELKRYSAQIVEPYTIVLNGWPKAWSPGLDKPLTADVVYVDAKNDAELAKYKGKLKGAVVLVGPARELQPRFDPLAVRVSDSDLLGLANAAPTSVSPPGQARAATASERRAMFAGTPAGRALLNRSTTGPTTRRSGRFGQFAFAGRILSFAAKEGAALIVTPSTQGDGGTIFVAQASIPNQQPGNRGGPRPWSVDCPDIPPQVELAVEDYNRLVRMTQQGVKLKMAADLQVQYHTEDLNAYNTIAEIPGTDLADEIVMVGGHLDSWQSATGATDNGAGVVAAMEAVRIIKTLNLHPRRTIRVALWTGEEEGLLGSRAYVKKHFGYYPDAQSPYDRVPGGARRSESSTTRPTSRPSRPLVREAEYEKLSVYFNLDNGAGKIRGVYLQGNEAARPIFRKWIAPFADLGAATLTASNTGSTDHVSFDAVGLPAFQFIQDGLEYFSRTHHSNEDVVDRVPADDLKQCATIMAAFVYDAAMMDERFPRKPVR